MTEKFVFWTENHRLSRSPRFVIGPAWSVDRRADGTDFTVEFHSFSYRPRADADYVDLDIGAVSAQQASPRPSGGGLSANARAGSGNREDSALGFVDADASPTSAEIGITSMLLRLPPTIRIAFPEAHVFELLRRRLPPDLVGRDVDVAVHFYIRFKTDGRAAPRPREPQFTVKAIFQRGRGNAATANPTRFRFVPKAIDAPGSKFADAEVASTTDAAAEVTVAFNPLYRYRSRCQPLFLFWIEPEGGAPGAIHTADIELRLSPGERLANKREALQKGFIRIYEAPPDGVRVSVDGEYVPSFPDAGPDGRGSPRPIIPDRETGAGAANGAYAYTHALVLRRIYVFCVALDVLDYDVSDFGARVEMDASLNGDDGGPVNARMVVALRSQGDAPHILMWSDQVDAAVVVPEWRIKPAPSPVTPARTPEYQRPRKHNVTSREAIDEHRFFVENFATSAVDVQLADSLRIKEGIPATVTNDRGIPNDLPLRPETTIGLEPGWKLLIHVLSFTKNLSVHLNNLEDLFVFTQVPRPHKLVVAFDLGTSNISMVIDNERIPLGEVFGASATEDGLALSAVTGITVDFFEGAKLGRDTCYRYQPPRHLNIPERRDSSLAFLKRSGRWRKDHISPHHKLALHLPLRTPLSADDAETFMVAGRGHMIILSPKIDICRGDLVASYLGQNDFDVEDEFIFYRSGPDEVSSIRARHLRSEDVFAGVALMLLDPVRASVLSRYKEIAEGADPSARASADKIVAALNLIAAPGERSMVIAVARPASLGKRARDRYRAAVEEAFKQAEARHIGPKGEGSRLRSVEPWLVSEGNAAAHWIWSVVKKKRELFWRRNGPARDKGACKLIVFDIGAGTLEVTVAQWTHGDLERPPETLRDFAVWFAGDALDDCIINDICEQTGTEAALQEGRAPRRLRAPAYEALRLRVRAAKESHDARSPVLACRVALRKEVRDVEVAVSFEEFATQRFGGRRPTHVQMYLAAVAEIVVPAGLRACADTDDVLIVVSGQAVRFAPLRAAIQRGVELELGNGDPFNPPMVRSVADLLSITDLPRAGSDASIMKTVVAEGAAIWATERMKSQGASFSDTQNELSSSDTQNELSSNFVLVTGVVAEYACVAAPPRTGFVRIDAIHELSPPTEIRIGRGENLFLALRPPGARLEHITGRDHGNWTGDIAAGEFSREIVNRLLRIVVVSENSGESAGRADGAKATELLDESRSGARAVVAVGPATLRATFMGDEGRHQLRVFHADTGSQAIYCLDDVGAWGV